jgi:hypothetical protein
MILRWIARLARPGRRCQAELAVVFERPRRDRKELIRNVMRIAKSGSRFVKGKKKPGFP